MKMLYQIQRWDHGWTIVPAPFEQGVPMDTLQECLQIFPKNALMFHGIVHHLVETGVKTIFAIASTQEGKAWEAEILESLKNLPPQERWWKGIDVGRSSASIFGVFADEPWASRARNLGDGATPLDADDFGRCHRLLAIFPEWRREIQRVGEAYPKTTWPRLALRWGELEGLYLPFVGNTASCHDLNAVLTEMHKSAPGS